MNSQDAEHLLLDIIAKNEFRHEDWANKKFAAMKIASATEKGSIGEDFLASILREIGYSEVAVLQGRRGDYDVAVEWQRSEVKFEVKVATMDTNGAFQFNGIRFDTRYSHLFCLGIMPDEAKYLIVPRGWLNNKKEFNMVSMAKGSNAAFKLTKKPNDLKPLGEFKSDIDAMLKK